MEADTAFRRLRLEVGCGIAYLQSHLPPPFSPTRLKLSSCSTYLPDAAQVVRLPPPAGLPRRARRLEQAKALSCPDGCFAPHAVGAGQASFARRPARGGILRLARCRAAPDRRS